jgi:hypothetical protein
MGPNASQYSNPHFHRDREHNPGKVKSPPPFERPLIVSPVLPSTINTTPGSYHPYFSTRLQPSPHSIRTKSPAQVKPVEKSGVRQYAPNPYIQVPIGSHLLSPAVSPLDRPVVSYYGCSPSKPKAPRNEVQSHGVPVRLNIFPSEFKQMRVEGDVVIPGCLDEEVEDGGEEETSGRRISIVDLVN